MNHLETVSDDRMTQALLEGLASWRARNTDNGLVDYRQLVGCLLVALRGSSQINEEDALREIVANQIDVPEQGRERSEHPDNLKILAAIWRLVAWGVIYPRFRHARDGYPIQLDSVTITPAGERVLARTGTGIPGVRVSDSIQLRFEDAKECLFHGLFRAAVVMIGLAYEELCQKVHDELRTRGRLSSSPRNQRDRVQELITFVQGLPSRGPNTEKRHRGIVALGTAEAVRRKRNDASHPGNRFVSHQEVEELLFNATRGVAGLYDVRGL